MNRFSLFKKISGRKGLPQFTFALRATGIFFKVTSATFQDNAYQIYLEELNIHSEHLQRVKLISKGFYEEVTVQDFPLRGKACFLKIKRRKWLIEETGKNLSRDWNLVANGTQMKQEFALFLKRNDLTRPL